MKVLFVINDSPYGTERPYNALRLAMALQKEPVQSEVTIFLQADAVGAAIPGQKTPDGYYNIERMLKAIVAKGGKVLLCGSCLDARGLSDHAFVKGAARSSMAEQAAEVASADRVLVY